MRIHRRYWCFCFDIGMGRGIEIKSNQRREDTGEIEGNRGPCCRAYVYVHVYVRVREHVSMGWELSIRIAFHVS